MGIVSVLSAPQTSNFHHASYLLDPQSTNLTLDTSFGCRNHADLQPYPDCPSARKATFSARRVVRPPQNQRILQRRGASTTQFRYTLLTVIRGFSCPCSIGPRSLLDQG